MRCFNGPDSYFQNHIICYYSPSFLQCCFLFQMLRFWITFLSDTANKDFLFQNILLVCVCGGGEPFRLQCIPILCLILTFTSDGTNHFSWRVQQCMEALKWLYCVPCSCYFFAGRASTWTKLHVAIIVLFKGMLICYIWCVCVCVFNRNLAWWKGVYHFYTHPDPNLKVPPPFLGG